MELNDRGILVDRSSILNRIEGNLTGNAYNQTNLSRSQSQSKMGK
jgi:hypothetical protein